MYDGDLIMHTIHMPYLQHTSTNYQIYMARSLYAVFESQCSIFVVAGGRSGRPSSLFSQHTWL